MVKSTEELIEIRDELYRKLYRIAYPGGDYDELVEKQDEFDHKVFNLHYLPDPKIISIIDTFLGNKDLRKSEFRKIKNNILMGAAPNGNLKTVNKYREEEEGLQPLNEENIEIDLTEEYEEKQK